MGYERDRARALRNGIGVIAWAREHEEHVRTMIDAGEAPGEVLEWHETKLAWLQHERLVHLVVTFMTMIAMFAGAAFLTWSVSSASSALSVAATAFTLSTAVLFAFYFAHYCRLENTVQWWYVVADALRDAADGRTDGGGVTCRS